MESILLEDPLSGSSARIAAHLGFNCHEFRALVGSQTIDVIDSDPDFASGGKRPSGNGIPILFPFPNRIRGGQYVWDGRTYEMRLSEVADDGRGNAIHGFCLDRPWRILEQGRQFVVGEFQLSVDAPERLPFWPTDCSIQVRYEVRGPSLRADIRVANPGDRPLPWGLGTHPYFRVPLSSGSEPRHCLIVAPAAETWELADFVPTGERKPVAPEKDLRDGQPFGQVMLDDVLTGLEVHGTMLECDLMDEHAGLQISQLCDPAFRELVVFTPPGRNAVCLEPYTCVTDAINLQQRGMDAGLRVLQPGEEFRTWIEILVGQVIA